jgi:hypothetical protein
MTSELAKISDEQVQLAYAAIMGDAELPVASDPEAMSRAIVERIMSADTFDEAFRPQQLESWQSYLDQPVKVREFHLNRSAFEDGQGAPIYAVVDIELLSDGEIVTVTCGGRNVLTQLVKMLQKGWQDNPVQLTARKTSEGYTALWLTAA